MRILEIFVGAEDYDRIRVARLALLGVFIEVGTTHATSWWVNFGWTWFVRGKFHRRWQPVEHHHTFYLDWLRNMVSIWWANCGWNADRRK